MAVSFDDGALRDSFVEAVNFISGELLETGVSAERIGLAALQRWSQAVCVTDAQINPPGPTISVVNNAYLDIFRCDVDQAVGRSRRVGQGPLTNRHVLDRLRSHIEAGESIQAQAINYRFDRFDQTEHAPGCRRLGRPTCDR